MFEEELQKKIRQSELEFSELQKRYVEGVKSRKDYNTLRSIREEMRKIKSELEELYPKADKEKG